MYDRYHDCSTCIWREECVAGCIGYMMDPEFDDGDYDEDEEEDDE